MSAVIRAKFRVIGVHKTEQCETATLSAVYSDDPNNPNHQWSKYTPCGNLTISITNTAAHGKLVEGGEYYIDFTPVEAKDDSTGDLFSGD